MPNMSSKDYIKDYKSYDEMSDSEKASVDQIVENYRKGELNTDYTGISNVDVDAFIKNRLDLEHLHKINEKLIESEKSANAVANQMRYQLFEDRWKNGYYHNGEHQQVPVNVNVNTNDSAEVRALKDEVKSLKSDINELKELLIDKLK